MGHNRTTDTESDRNPEMCLLRKQRQQTFSPQAHRGVLSVARKRNNYNIFEAKDLKAVNENLTLDQQDNLERLRRAKERKYEL